MKVFIVLSAFVAVASATYLPAVAPLATAAITSGQSSQFRAEDNYGNYNFGYDESHATGATSRREEQINGVRRGMYALSDADGRRRTVNYVADAAGFRAAIDTNEPGVEPKDPADVTINKAAATVAVVAAPAPVAVAAPVTYTAPAPVTYAAPAPVAVAAPAPVTYAAPAPVATYTTYAAPAAVATAPVAVEAPTPRAFSYAFGASHLSAAPLATAARYAY